MNALECVSKSARALILTQSHTLLSFHTTFLLLFCGVFFSNCVAVIVLVGPFFCFFVRISLSAMPAHSCRGPRCILTCFAAAIALIFIVSVAAGQELEPAQQKNQGVKKNRKVAHNFPDHAPTLASATDVLFVLLPSVTAAPLAAGQEEDAFAESISAADAQRATLLMQSIEHEYGGDQSARVGAVLLSQVRSCLPK